MSDNHQAGKTKHEEPRFDFLAGLLDSTNLVVYLKDKEGKYIYVNKRYERLATFPREALLGKSDPDFFKPEVAALFRSQDAQVTAHRGPIEFEETIPLPGGEHSFITEKFPLFDEKGEVRAVGGFCTEITTQKNRADESLAEERERLAVTMASISEGVVSTDTKGLVTMLNPAAEKLAGLKQAEAMGRDIDEVLQTADGELKGAFGRIAREAMASPAAAGAIKDIRLQGPEGAWRTVLPAASAVRDRRGSIIGAVLSLRDVTEQRRVEAELFKARNLKLLGVLAGGIAHDFNNILTGILGSLSILQLKAAGEYLDLITEAQDACGVAKGLSHQLLTFSSGGSPVVKVMDLRNLLLRAAEFAARGSSTRCVFDLGESPLVVNIDKDQIAQVVQNLVINAVQAMPQGGEIKVRALVVTLGEHQLPPLAAGPYVRVTVEDQGTGITPENLQHIFDPYFSTKASGRGLGLSVCHSIMLKHGGLISAVSKPGSGSAFTLHFPALSAEALAVESGQPALAAGSGRVLVMDDEAVVTTVSTRMLKLLGYKADFVEDGRAAVEAYRKAHESGKPYDAVILDLMIPGGMGGKEALCRLKAINPDVKALVSSGYSDHPIMSEYADYGFAGALCKPYRIAEVSEALRRILTP